MQLKCFNSISKVGAERKWAMCWSPNSRSPQTGSFQIAQ